MGLDDEFDHFFNGFDVEPSLIDEDDIIHILKREQLWHEPNEKLSLWNPPIYKTCALFENQKDIYRSFHVCAQMCLDMNAARFRFKYPGMM